MFVLHKRFPNYMCCKAIYSISRIGGQHHQVALVYYVEPPILCKDSNFYYSKNLTPMNNKKFHKLTSNNKQFHQTMYAHNRLFLYNALLNS